MEEKTFQETRVQIGLLKSRGVTIKNKRYAKWLIRDVNYYNLINGYKEPFLKGGTAYEQYLPGTTLEEIYALYEFDRKLRIITLEYILEIEKSAKSLIACCFSKAHGHKNYLRIENFDTQGRSKYHQVCDLLSSLYKKISFNIDKDPSISHFANCLFFLATIRNRCAHDERLYSYTSHTNLCSNRYFSYFRISSATNNYFAVMTAFKMLLSNKRYTAYQSQIEGLFDELSRRLTTIPAGRIRNMMGMPNNWRRLDSLT